MAKQAAAPAAPPPAEAPPAPPPAPAAEAPRFTRANKTADATVTDHVQWGNGEVVAERDVPTPEAGKADGEPTPNKAEPAEDDKTPAEAPEAKEAEEAEEKPAAAPAGNAERRRQIVESLAAERAKRTMENEITTLRKRAEDAEAARTSFEKLPLAEQLALVAKSKGMSVQDLADRLLIGGDEVQVAPAPKPLDPEVAALKAELAELKKHHTTTQEAEQRAKVEQAVGVVRDSLSKSDLPLVETYDAYPRVMMNAHEAWMAGGKKGSPMDYVADCAAVVEDELKAEHPKAAARLYPKATPAAAAATETSEEAPPAAAARPAVGKRTGAKPDAKPKSIWEGGKTTAEVDAEIKKQYGWG